MSEKREVGQEAPMVVGPRDVARLARALRELIDAVHAISDDPKPANVDRYLRTSRAFERSRRLGPARSADSQG